MSDGWALEPAPRRSSFSLPAGLWKQVARSVPLGCAGWAAGGARPRFLGARARPGGYAGAQERAGTRNRGVESPSPSVRGGSGPCSEGEVWTEVAFCGDSLEERDEDAKNKSKPVECSTISRVAGTQRCYALSVNELLSTFSVALEGIVLLPRLTDCSFRLPSPSLLEKASQRESREAGVTPVAVLGPHHSLISTRCPRG